MRRVVLMVFMAVLFLVLVAWALSSSWLHTGFVQRTHQPISFPYILNYDWNYQTGASIRISTVNKFSHLGVIILYDIKPITSIFDLWLLGWTIIPYAIYDPPGGHPQMIGSATVSIPLGEIKDGDYLLKIRMSDVVDTFHVRKTASTFSVEKVLVTEGKLIGKTEFETRLDGFRVDYVGYPKIDNGTKQYMIDQIVHLGGTILGTENGSTDGWLVYLNFLYTGDVRNLAYIITHLPWNSTGCWIRIESNTCWLSPVS